MRRATSSSAAGPSAAAQQLQFGVVVRVVLVASRRRDAARSTSASTGALLLLVVTPSAYALARFASASCLAAWSAFTCARMAFSRLSGSWSRSTRTAVAAAAWRPTGPAAVSTPPPRRIRQAPGYHAAAAAATATAATTSADATRTAVAAAAATDEVSEPRAHAALDVDDAVGKVSLAARYWQTPATTLLLPHPSGPWMVTKRRLRTRLTILNMPPRGR